MIARNLLVLIVLLAGIDSQRPAGPAGLQGFGTGMNISILRTLVVPDEATLRVILSDKEQCKHIWIKMVSKEFRLSSSVRIVDCQDIILEGPCTFTHLGLVIENSSNVIVYNIRVYNVSLDGILVSNSSNIVIDSVTVLDSSRSDIVKGKDIDLTENSVNITLSHSIIGYADPPALQKYKGLLVANFSHARVTNVSIHHCLFYRNYQRSPEISTPGLIDFLNNVVYDYTEYGTRVRNGAYGNFMSNYYLGGKKDPMVFVEAEAQVHAANNLWKENLEKWTAIAEKIDAPQFDVPKVTTLDEAELKVDMRKWGCHGDSDSILRWEGPITKTVQSAWTENLGII